MAAGRGGDPGRARRRRGRPGARGRRPAGGRPCVLDADTARAVVTHSDLSQELEIRVDASGRPLWIRIPRWTNANPDQVYRLQPFGGELSDFRDVSGYRVPFRVDGGNFFGTPDYFPFYRARVTSLRLR